MNSGGLALFTLQRLLQAIPLLPGVIVINFTLIQLAPGDPATILIGDFPAPPEYVAQVREEFGLDQPTPVRLARYLGQVLQGNLRYSFANRQPVADLIGARLGATLQLTMKRPARPVALTVLGSSSTPATRCASIRRPSSCRPASRYQSRWSTAAH